MSDRESARSVTGAGAGGGRGGLSLQAVADVIDTTATRLSTLERELAFDTKLARRAHAYITT